LAGASLQIN